MITLGIADNHDSGAALTIDGALVAAVNQERVDRIKGSGAFPWGAIDATLEIAGVKAGEVDRVVVGTAFTPSAALRAFPSLHQRARAQEGTFGTALHAYVSYQSVLRKTGLYSLEVDACEQILRKQLRARPFDKADVVMMDHHQSHAEGAYRTQAQDPCLVLTVDAMGDGTTATVWMGHQGHLEQRFNQTGLAAINSFYARVTELLGFRPNRHEGKITGLAAMAEAPAALVAHMKTRVCWEGERFSRSSLRRAEHKGDPFWSEIAGWPREEVAAAAQQVLEEAVLAFASVWLDRTRSRSLAVSGGIFANVKLNQRLAELEEVDHLWVFPHMGDGGLALGAALGADGVAPAAMESARLGQEFSQRDCYKALKRAEVDFENWEERGAVEGAPGDVARVAGLLAEGKVVGCFQGRMEWGPRALGARSVLVRPDLPQVNDWLNKRLARSEFMPFAPIVRAEDGERWFKGLGKVADSARFMTVCVDCTDDFKARCPGAVHVDGTARPQLLREQDDPRLHRLLGLVGEKTGTPVLINTSFNRHEEPIVCTPSDATKAAVESRFHALWMGPYVAEGRASDDGLLRGV